MTALLPFVVLCALGQAPARLPQDVLTEIKAQIAAITDRLTELDRLLGPQTVAPSQLQAALEKGGEIHLEKAGIYPLSIVVRSNTHLYCHGAGFVGERKIPFVPAIDILPGTSHVVLEDCAATTAYSDSVIRIGRNTATEQGTLDKVPTDIVFQNVSVPTHRGKRAFEIHGELTCYACIGADVWDPAGQDSQVIWVGNTTGNVHIEGGDFCGASETFLLGGDSIKLPAGVIQTNITIRNARFCHLLTWQKDGVARKIKNLLEFKTGQQIRVEHVTLDGSWQDGQDGYGIMVTPRSGGEIHDIVFEDVTVAHVASGFQITGADNNSLTPNALTGFVARRVSVTASKALYGGRGVFALIGTEPEDLTFENCVGNVDSNTTFAYYFGTRRMTADNAVTRNNGHIKSLTITNGFYTVGSYGFIFQGQNNGANWNLSVDALNISGNTFTGAGAVAIKKFFPTNTYVDRAAWDAAVAAR